MSIGNKVFTLLDTQIMVSGVISIGATLTALSIKYYPILRSLSYLVSILVGLVTIGLAVYKFIKKVKSVK